MIAAVALGLVAAACSSDPPMPTVSPAAADQRSDSGARNLLPATRLPVLGTDQATTIAELAGGLPAVVNFWATWCAFCVDEMPDLQAAAEALEDRVAFVGVDREDLMSRALELASRTGVRYPLVEDADGSFFRAVGARGMPTTLLVDADGGIVHRHSGPVTTEQLLSLVAEHLGIIV